MTVSYSGAGASCGTRGGEREGSESRQDLCTLSQTLTLRFAHSAVLMTAKSKGPPASALRGYSGFIHVAASQMYCLFMPQMKQIDVFITSKDLQTLH